MATYTASNGAIVADLTALIATPSTSLPASGFVALFVAAENSWYEYNPALTSGDATPINNPASGRWIRIGRDKFIANRTYYIATTGSDSNNGLTVGAPFLTWAKAQQVAASVDGNGFEVTIKFADGTYTTPIVVDKTFVGISKLTLEGNTTTPANCIVSVTGNGFYVDSESTKISVKGFRVVASVIGIYVYASVSVEIRNFNFGACTFHFVNRQSNIDCGTYTIAGNATNHWLVDQGLIFMPAGTVITLTGTPAFSDAFAFGRYLGEIENGATFSGSATGKRYSATANSVIISSGVTFPGSIAGTTDGTGVYI